MKKENMLTRLERAVEKKLPEDADFAIDWDRKNHTVELIVVLYAANPESQQIEDADGVLSEETVIEFEDSILLYHPEKSVFDAEDYLAVFPYQGKKGLPTAFIDQLAGYLADVVTDGLSDLLDFLADETAEVFELNWQDEEFERRLASADLTDFAAYPNY
ncbi:DUF3013 family protein [Vagococcus acidifermentans]|uniref:DUF3013 domain-containing protein n=1 Tax=Vagococcus acidifermentans TaxID=564710 RepID=A0A430AT16_9ENTE|nr:DUF3013 family protein [Vagococcus acidifermentans]RSU11202.1 hypothetical protein CBF27_08880 [Vagococcus acidifermentans]